MATLITHAIVGASIGFAASRWKLFRERSLTRGLVLGSTIISMLPDADVILWRVVPYNSFFGHRGFFHSPFFLIVISFVAAYFFSGKAERKRVYLLAGVWSLAGITHPLLDALTDGGYGPMMFFPFSEGRFFFDWRPIRVAPIGFRRFWGPASQILLTELPFCLASLGLAAASWFVARIRNRQSTARITE